MSRKVMDCRKVPSDVGCTLVIAGEEEDVVTAATQHAVSAHREKDSPELREMIRKSLADETPMTAPAERPGEQSTMRM